MTSANTITGRNGKFVVNDQLVARTKNWSVNPSVGGSEWGDSDSNGYTNRSSGRRDATFDAEGVYSIVSEQFDLFKPGDIAEAVLWLNATNLYYDFPRALCRDFSLTVDIDTEEVIGWTSGWGADGEYYAPGEAGASSHSLPA